MPMYPRDRLLAFLAKIANEPGPDLEPRNWLEYYLDKIADACSGGGGGGDALILNATFSDTLHTDVLDHTAGDIYNAFTNGRTVVVYKSIQGVSAYDALISAVNSSEEEPAYTFTAGYLSYYADTENDYPRLQTES